MAQLSKILAVAALCLSSVIVAHPGEHIDKVAVYKEMKARGLEAEEQKKSLDQCSDAEHTRERRERAYARRAATVQRLREERGIANEPFVHRRNLAQFNSWGAKSHDRTKTLTYNSSTPAETLFGTNTSCILTPDNANGPYYVLGEQIRSNVTEGKVGIPMHLEIQFIDTTTCKALQPAVVDIWSCDALGVYSGVSASGEGGLASTFLRGVQQTDNDGVVNFDTNFPGHYSGRATHEHIITHTGATINANGTFSGGHISHLSQLFFDQALITAVEATAPYNTNKIAKTSNTADFFTGYSATAAYDPFPEYIQLGSDLSKGLFVWIEIGVKPTNDFTTYGTNAAYRDAKGGHDNPGFNMNIVASPPPTAG